MGPKLTITGVSFKKENHWLLSDININFSRGVHAVAGPNGGGKTTLLRLIAGLDKPTDGQILLDNRDIFEEPQWFYGRLGYLPQKFQFYRQMTCQTGLLYLSALKGINHKIARERVAEVIEMLALEEVKNLYFTELSGGLKKRLGIAQAILNDPDLLLLDEPTTSLDPAERVKLRMLLHELGKERIIIFTTHFMEEAEEAKSLTVLREGKRCDLL